MSPATDLSAACAEGLRRNAGRFLEFIGPGPLEFQILGAPDRFTPNRFCHARSVDEALTLLDVAEKIAPVGTYVILNAPDEAVTTRMPVGKWHPLPKGAATTDSDIRARRALYIDVDAKRVSGTSATDGELACALATTERVYALFKGLLGPEALAVGHSGNGGSVFIALDSIPESPELATLCKGVLAAVAARFANEPGSAIDTTVCDAKRLCPAFGTTKRKGAPGIVERPHRQTGIATPQAVRRLSFGELQDLFGKLYDDLDGTARGGVDKAMGKKPPQANPPPTSPRSSPPSEVSPGDPFARAKTVPIRDVLTWLSLLDTATDQPTCPGCGLDDHGVAIVKNGLKCSHNRCASKGFPSGFRTTIDVVLEACKLQRPIDAVRLLGDRFGFELPARPPLGPSKSAHMAAAPKAPRALTDLGNAERFVAAHGQNFRHCAGLGWLVYDGKRWTRDTTGERMRSAKATARSIYAEAANADELSVRQAIASWAKRSEGSERLTAMLKLAETEAGIAIDISELDADPWALNVENGTIDLRTGKLRAHRREDHITKIAGTAYDPDATCPLFERFLGKVFQDNAALIAFVRRFMGYSLTASVREQVLAFFYGAGANGKSTLIDLMIDLLGSHGGYAKPAAPGLLIAKKGETHPTELADLHGARLVTCVEIGDGKRFDEERVKALTGGDAIKARFMRQDFFTFNPTHKLLIAANHRPTVRGTDHAIWRRILLVPFNVTFSDTEKDPELPAKLRTELPGILKWAVDGCLEWQRDGLKPPPTVLEATNEYRDGEDVVGRFIQEKCIVRDYASAGATELYSLYRAWATAAGEVPVSQTRFGRSLGERGFRAERSSSQRVWRGIGIVTEIGCDESDASEPAGDPLCDEPVAVGVSAAAVAESDSPKLELPAESDRDAHAIAPPHDGYDGLDPIFHIASPNENSGATYLGKTRHTRHHSIDGSKKSLEVREVTTVTGRDGLEIKPVTNPSYPSRPTSDANERPPPTSPVEEILIQLLQLAPKLRVDAMGDVVGFGTLAAWPQELRDAFEVHRNAIRDALLAKQNVGETTPKKGEDP